MSAQQFMEMLFGKLPEFFKDEDELRALWSAPDTRKKLLQALAEKGFGHEQLGEMQKIINAEKSDLFDVLAYVAYALPPLNREERAARAKVVISTHFGTLARTFPAGGTWLWRCLHALARVRVTCLAWFRFQRFPVPLRIAEVTVRLHEVVDGEVVLPVVKPCTSSDDLLELNHAVDRTH
jgi:hypothetical protein